MATRDAGLLARLVVSVRNPSLAALLSDEGSYGARQAEFGSSSIATVYQVPVETALLTVPQVVTLSIVMQASDGAQDAQLPTLQSQPAKYQSFGHPVPAADFGPSQVEDAGDSVAHNLKRSESPFHKTSYSTRIPFVIDIG